MKGSKNTPVVFISYSWSGPEHKDWVLSLAEKLVRDGIDVVIDEWDLQEGQDKHEFMERSVTDESIDKVLVICDKQYKEKANNREGGVGEEAQLISPKVYKDTDQEKFIPIIKEKDDDGNPYLPEFMSSRVYIDFSFGDDFGEGYDDLLRNLYDEPEYQKPSLGSPPASILQRTSLNKKDSDTDSKNDVSIATNVKHALIKNPETAEIIIKDYFNKLNNELESNRLKKQEISSRLDKVVMESINQLLLKRDELLNVLEVWFNYGNKIDSDVLHDFLNNLISLSLPQKDEKRWNKLQFDNFKFFLYDLFLHITALLLKYKEFQVLSDLIYKPYFYHHPIKSGTEISGIDAFNQYIKSLDDIRNKKENLNRVCVTADEIKENVYSRLDFQNIKEADLILHYIASFCEGIIWFPRCSVYFKPYSGISYFDKLISKDFFENFKPLLDIKSIEELKDKVNNYNPKIKMGIHYDIPPLSNVIDLENIGSKR